MVTVTLTHISACGPVHSELCYSEVNPELVYFKVKLQQPFWRKIVAIVPNSPLFRIVHVSRQSASGLLPVTVHASVIGSNLVTVACIIEATQ